MRPFRSGQETVTTIQSIVDEIEQWAELLEAAVEVSAQPLTVASLDRLRRAARRLAPEKFGA